MKPLMTVLLLAVTTLAVFAQGSATTPQVAAATRLQSDLEKALSAASLTAEEKSKLTKDAAQLVTNANLRAQGGAPDRKVGRAAGEEIARQSQGGKFQSADAALLKADLKALQAAAR